MNANINVNVSFDGVEDNDIKENSNVNGAKRISEIETMHLREDYGVVDEIPDSTKLYRYINYRKLESMLKEQSIYFSNAKKNLDKRERQIPDQCYKGYGEETKDFNKRINNQMQEIVKSYLSCWTTEEDGYALWKIYDHSVDGCRICTTFGDLKSQMEGKNVVFFEVKYIDIREDRRLALPPISFESGSMPGTIRGSERYKIKSYKYEKEIRGVIYSKEDCDGILVDVNPSKLIKSVMLNPFSTDEAQERVKRLIEKYIGNVEYEESQINEWAGR